MFRIETIYEASATYQKYEYKDWKCSSKASDGTALRFQLFTHGVA